MNGDTFEILALLNRYMLSIDTHDHAQLPTTFTAMGCTSARSAPPLDATRSSRPFTSGMPAGSPPAGAMAIAAFVGTLCGTPVYGLLARRSGTGRPVAWVIVCAVVVTVYSAAQLFNPQLKDLDGAVLLVNCMDVAVGLVAALVLPRLASK